VSSDRIAQEGRKVTRWATQLQRQAIKERHRVHAEDVLGAIINRCERELNQAAPFTSIPSTSFTAGGFQPPSSDSGAPATPTAGSSGPGRPSNSAASDQSRRSSSLRGSCCRVHVTALSNHTPASSSRPGRFCAKERKNQSLASPPRLSSIDLRSAAM